MLVCWRLFIPYDHIDTTLMDFGRVEKFNLRKGLIGKSWITCLKNVSVASILLIPPPPHPSLIKTMSLPCFLHQNIYLLDWNNGNQMNCVCIQLWHPTNPIKFTCGDLCNHSLMYYTVRLQILDTKPFDGITKNAEKIFKIFHLFT